MILFKFILKLVFLVMFLKIGGRYAASYNELELKICSCFLVTSRNYICKEASESMFNSKFLALFCPLETEGIKTKILRNIREFFTNMLELHHLLPL